MKPALQFATSVIALGALLGTVASNAATNIAELPLKASVLAKPNVIWGVDDSGSMDGELMLSTNDGAFWWDYDNANGWDSTGKPNFNGPGDATSRWRKMVYLFPNGTGVGNRVYADDDHDHFAIMPTSQFAWLRSSSYNPLYYDSAVTYSPWSPAYVGGAVVNYGNASTTAAKSHPVYGTGTMNVSADVALTTSTNQTFMALPGMTVPSGAQYCTHDGSAGCSTGWATAGSAFTVAAGTALRVAMAYYPATFYVKESCPLAEPTCVAAPDGATLKRYEIKADVSFPSGRTHAAELQNFANWWQYYRKRKIMLNAAIGKVLEPLTGMRMGVVVFNNRNTVTMYDTDATAAASNGRRVAGLFYNLNGSGGTPTRETLKYIGEQFINTSSVVQYACQRNNAFIVTDGFANASSVTMPNYDDTKSQSTWGSGAPYETVHSGSLADLALRYYTNNLRSSMATGKVPATPNDANTNLHMNTYGMTLGAKGTIYQGDGTPLPTDTAAWPNPSSNRSPTSVDDLWHATINGRGRMYTAATPTETRDRIQSALNDMLSAIGAQSGVSVSTVNLSRSDGFAYMGRYNPAGWAGDLTANAINATTGAISTTATWSAASILAARDWTTRQIVTQVSDGSGTVFNATNVGATVNPSDAWGVTADVIDYLRGDRSKEGSAFRTRTSLMGAVINAEPVISREDDMVFLASGEGMLHAFDTRSGSNRGKELWAFVPRAVLTDIGQTSARAYTFKTQLDGTPTIGKIGTSSKLLVAGMGAAGRSYYALDVSTPRTNTQSDTSWVKWEFPLSTDSTTVAKVGQTMGKPLIVNTSAGYRVLVTSGYNSTADGKGRLFVLNRSTGVATKEFTSADGSLSNAAGLAHVSAFLETDGTVRYVYGGDLLGNLWRFDLDAATGTAPTKVAVLKNAANTAQPVTAAPELAYFKGKRVVLVGTGRLLDATDFGNNSVQSFYAIADGATITDVRSTLVQQTYNGHSTDTITTATVDWTTGRGWFMDLPAGELANTQPAFADGVVAFVSNAAGSTDCTASSYLYVMNGSTGAAVTGLGYVSSLISSTSNASSVRAVLTTSQGAGSGGGGGGGGGGDTNCPPGSIVGIGQTASGESYRKCIGPRTPIVPGKNSWREVRPR